MLVSDHCARLRAAAIDANDDERHDARSRAGIERGLLDGADAGTADGPEAGCVYEDRIPTTRVITVPMRTYQGQAMVPNGRSISARAGTAPAICLAKTTKAMVRIPSDIPCIASDCRARRHKIPRKKPPRRPPYVNDAIDSATTTTGV